MAVHLPAHFARAVVAAALVVVLLSIATIGDWYTALRERAFDEALVAMMPSLPPASVVVDIDRDTLEVQGAWPWARDRLAILTERIADAGAKVLAIDIVVTGPDTRSPSALARQLATETGDPALLQLAGRLIDGDQALAEALAKVPSVLGVALDPENDTQLAKLSPILIPADVSLAGLWQSSGVVAALPLLQASAASSGVVALPGDADAAVRRVPLLASAGNSVIAGLAIEAVRLSEGGPPIVLTGDGRQLLVGQRRIPFAADGLLRLLPLDGAVVDARTISASRLFTDPTIRQQLNGRLVLLGSSAPESGGLRPTGGDSLGASIQLQAQAVDQIMAGLIPRRPGWLGLFETLATAAAGLMTAVAGALWRPVRAGLATIVVAVAWVAAAAAALKFAYVLLDPLGVVVAAMLGFATSALVAAAATAQREALIRRRFEQHLAPGVVSRIVEQPELLKLSGELREVTALFTDVEGFTAMTERSDPQALVSVLDRYFEVVCQIIVDAGGMVDKIVGDGVHAIFNAPFDLADHAGAAVRAGRSILDATERFRREPDAAAIGFGRTRIGIETGRAIVGDVGGGRKLDYTAHGDAVNSAARLEAANKLLGSQICIGAGTAGLLPPETLRPMGRIAIRGRGHLLAVFDHWPASYSADDRERYLAAAALADTDPSSAILGLQPFAAEPTGDAVAAGWISRLATAECSTEAAAQSPLTA